MNSTGADYKFGNKQPHTADYLHDPIVNYCRNLGVKRIFDLGCGNGHLCRRLSSEGFGVGGCDPSDSGIAAAKALVPSGKFYHLGVYDSPTNIETDWDVVVSTEVVEHLFYPRELPRFARKILKPDGHLIISTPYHGWLKNVLIATTGKWDFHHTPLKDGGHIKFWSKATLSKILAEEEFREQTFIGAGRIPWLWKSMILVSDRIG